MLHLGNPGRHQADGGAARRDAIWTAAQFVAMIRRLQGYSDRRTTREHTREILALTDADIRSLNVEPLDPATRAALGNPSGLTIARVTWASRKGLP